MAPGVNPEIFISPDEFGLKVELALSVFPSTPVGFADSEKEVIRAPPLSVGALVATVALPRTPAVIVRIEGAAGGPSGRYQVVVICVLGLHLLRSKFKSGLALLWHVLIEILLEPGVPTGTVPL